MTTTLIMLDHTVSSTVDTRSQRIGAAPWGIVPGMLSAGFLLRLWGPLALPRLGRRLRGGPGPCRSVGTESPEHLCWVLELPTETRLSPAQGLAGLRGETEEQPAVLRAVSSVSEGLTQLWGKPSLAAPASFSFRS